MNVRARETSLETWAPTWGGGEMEPLKQYMQFYTDSYKSFTATEHEKL